MTLIGYWKCNENQGKDVSTVVDSSGHANNHDFGTVVYTSDSYGFVNNARHAPGSAANYHGSVGNNSDLQLTGDTTIMAWVRPLIDPPGYRWVIGCAQPGAAQADNILWCLRFLSSGAFDMGWEYGANNGVSAASPTGIISGPAEAPMHLAVVRSINGANRDVKFFVDGADLAADVTGLTAPDGGGNSTVEMLRFPNDNSEYIAADIWNVRVYDSAESAGAVSAVYAAELGEATRAGYPTNPALAASQVLGSGAYTSVPTGTNLDIDERPNSGWATTGP